MKRVKECWNEKKDVVVGHNLRTKRRQSKYVGVWVTTIHRKHVHTKNTSREKLLLFYGLHTKIISKTNIEVGGWVSACQATRD